jgi:hypothetical protein
MSTDTENLATFVGDPEIAFEDDDQGSPFFCGRLDVLREHRLSPEIRWFFLYLCSNDKNWTIRISQLREHLKAHYGRDKFRNLVSDSVKIGFLKRATFKKDNLLRTRYTVVRNFDFNKFFRLSENPYVEDLLAVSREVGFQAVERPHCLSTIKDLQSKSNKRKGGLAPPAPPPPPLPIFEYTGKFSDKKRVVMLQSEYDKLVESYGLDLTLEFLERLDNWADENPKGFKEKKSHAATVNRWIRDHLSEDKIRSAAGPAFVKDKFPPSKAMLERDAARSAEKLRAKYPDRVYIGTEASSMKRYIRLDKPRHLVLPGEHADYSIYLDDADFTRKFLESCEKWGFDTDGIV